MKKNNDNYLFAMQKQRILQKDNFYKKCKDINGDTIDFSNFIYTGNRGRSICKCKLCGYEWQDVPELLYKRKFCPQCQKNIKQEEQRKIKLKKHKEDAEVIYKNHNISDIAFFYNEKNVLMVKFYCHEKYCDGTEHGIQIQTGLYFLKQQKGCAKCASNLSQAYTTEEWVRLAKNKYPEFSYDKTVYINKDTKVVITCHRHGDKLVNPKDFIHGDAYCPDCTKERLHNEFVHRVIERAQEKHKNDNYIYHPELIIDSKSKMGVECPKHGIFWQTINNHIHKGTQCPECVKENFVNPKKFTFEEAVALANIKHNNRYTYHKDSYVNTMSKTLITCPIHGDFQQTMHNHLAGQGCPKCGSAQGGLMMRLSQEEFLSRIQKIHKNKGYDFSKVIYQTYNDKVIVICPKHGEFQIKALHLLLGSGCPMCKMPKLEIAVKNELISNHIVYEEQKRFKQWLGRQSLDFYIPEKNIGIECQGIQHFKNDRRYNKLDEVQERDLRKKQLCKDNNVHLIYYVPEFFSEYMSDDDIFFSKINDLIDYIQSYKPNNK